MATAEITPAISAPDTTSSAPVSSEPSSSTSSVSTSGPSSEGKPESSLSGPETLNYLRDALAKVPQDQLDAAKRGEEPKPQTVKPAEEKPAIEPAKPAAEAAKPEEKKPGEEAKPAEQVVNPLDKLGPIPAEQIAKAFQDNPSLEATLAPLGLGQNDLTNLARGAARDAQFREHFATPELAKYGKESAGHFYDIEDSFPAISDLKGFDDFVMNTMLPLSVLRDANGEPLKNADGTFQTDGSVQKFLGFAGDAELGFLRMAFEDLAKNGQSEEDKEYGQRLSALVDELNDFRSAGYRRPGGKGGEPQLSPAQQAEMDRLRRENDQSRQRDAETREAQNKITEDTIFTDTLKTLEPLVGEILNRTALSDPLKKKAANEIYAALTDRLNGDRDYLRVKKDYWNRGGADMVQKLTAHNVVSLQGILSPVAEGILRDYGVDLVTSNAARHEKIDRQIANDRSTPTSQTTSAAAAPKITTDEEIDKQAEATVLARHGGRKTPGFQMEWMNEVVRLKQAAGAAV